VQIEEWLKSFQKQEKELKDKPDALQREKERLQLEKSVLIHNISCLFKMAQMEIARKDNQIRELHDEYALLSAALNLSLEGSELVFSHGVCYCLKFFQRKRCDELLIHPFEKISREKVKDLMS
jgi:hypothetical protein